MHSSVRRIGVDEHFRRGGSYDGDLHQLAAYEANAFPCVRTQPFWGGMRHLWRILRPAAVNNRPGRPLCTKRAYRT